jgi:hypothetical protein
MRQGNGTNFEMTCVAVNGSSADFVLWVNVVNNAGQTFIEFLPPLVIENVLASTCEIDVRDKTGRTMYKSTVDRGLRSKVHEIDASTGNNSVVISTTGFVGQLRQIGLTWPKTLRLRNRENQTLVLAVELTEVGNSCMESKRPGTATAVLMVFYTTHWILDYSNLNLEVVQQGVRDNMCTPVQCDLRKTAQQGLDVSPRVTSHLQTGSLSNTIDLARPPAGATLLGAKAATTLHMFSFLLPVCMDKDDAYDDGNVADRVVVRPSSEQRGSWSDPICVDGEQSRHPIHLVDQRRGVNVRKYQVCCNVRTIEGIYHRTKLAVFSPCCYVANRSDHTVMVKDAQAEAESDSILLKSGQSAAFHWSHSHADHELNCVCVRTTDFEWSKPLQINHADDFFVYVRKQNGGGRAIRVTVNLDNCTVTNVAFQWLDESYGQVKIENECTAEDTRVRFCQHGIKSAPIEVISGQSYLYAWEDPQLPRRLQVSAQAAQWDIDFDSVNARKPLRKGDYVLHVDAFGPMFVVRIVDSASSSRAEPNTPTRGFGSARAGRAPFADVHSKCTSWDVDVAGLGISFIDNKASGLTEDNTVRPTRLLTHDVQELIYCSISTLRLNMTTGSETMLDFSATYMQIDNQLRTSTGDGKYSVILVPTDKSQRAISEHRQAVPSVKPVLRLILEKGPNAEIDHYRAVSVTLSDLSISLDGNLIERVFGSQDANTASNIARTNPRTVWLFGGHSQATEVRDILQQQQQRLYWFADRGVAPRRVFIEKMQILPFTAVISHSGRPSVLATDGFENVPLHFAKYEQLRIHAASLSLMWKIRATYGRQLALKLPQFIGAASLFGNPAGALASDLCCSCVRRLDCSVFVFSCSLVCRLTRDLRINSPVLDITCVSASLYTAPLYLCCRNCADVSLRA